MNPPDLAELQGNDYVMALARLHKRFPDKRDWTTSEISEEVGHGCDRETCYWTSQSLFALERQRLAHRRKVGKKNRYSLTRRARAAIAACEKGGKP